MRPLMTLVPGFVTVIPMRAPTQPWQLWPLPRRARRPARRRTRRSTDADAADTHDAPPHQERQETEEAGEEDVDDDDNDPDEAYANLDAEDDHVVSNVNEDLLIQAEAMQSLFEAPRSSNASDDMPQPSPPASQHTPGQPSSSVAVAEPANAEIMVNDESQVDETREAPPSVPRAPRARAGPSSAAIGQMYVGGGVLSYYASKQCFEARCGNPGHHQGRRCVLSRSSLGRRVKGHATRMGGRPLAFMYLWLQKSAQVADRAGHWDPSCTFTLEERKEAREVLKGTDAGKILLEFERACEAEEPEEPETLVGIWP